MKAGPPLRQSVMHRSIRLKWPPTLRAAMLMPKNRNVMPLTLTVPQNHARVQDRGSTIQFSLCMSIKLELSVVNTTT